MLLFTDTDSLTYEVKSEDVYEDFYKDKHLFDLSNYPKDSKFFDSVNEEVIGKMKDVHKGKSFNKFVGLKSKMHSMLSDNDKESNTAKGVNIATEFKEYEDTQQKSNQTQNEKNSEQKHKIKTYEVQQNIIIMFWW